LAVGLYSQLQPQGLLFEMRESYLGRQKQCNVLEGDQLHPSHMHQQENRKSVLFLIILQKKITISSHKRRYNVAQDSLTKNEILKELQGKLSNQKDHTIQNKLQLQLSYIKLRKCT
jgi:hypothetical protein